MTSLLFGDSNLKIKIYMTMGVANMPKFDMQLAALVNHKFWMVVKFRLGMISRIRGFKNHPIKVKTVVDNNILYNLRVY
jgi:hypothetical protein